MLYSNRDDAGRQLAHALAAWRGQRPVVYAIPRGAVAMGKVVADALGGELDVVVTRKLGAPGNPEYAIGAVDETGWSVISDDAGHFGADRDYLERAIAVEMEAMRRRRAAYTPVRPPLDPAGRIAIVVDDGLATGATMVAALHAVRARGPSRLICAAPVGSPDAIERVRPHADEIVCLHAPWDFRAVGDYYVDFGQVDDAAVVALLRDAARTHLS